MIFLGITALSMYLIYKNKTSLAFNMLKLYTNIDENVTKYLYNKSIIYDVYNNNTLTKINTIDNIDFDNNNILVNYFYEGKNLSQILNSSNNTIINLDDEILLENYIRYNSSIISCSIDIIEDGKILYKEYDITDFINKFILYNCSFLLTNKQSIYKEFLIYLLNKYLEHRNINITSTNLIKWKIILDTIDIYEGSEINIYVKEGKISINNT
jgi:hypothetical protein